MKILLVNNFYYNRGGDCTYLFSLKKLLERKGHKVAVFSMHHPENFESEYSKYFVSYINYAEEIKNRNIYSGLKVLSRSIYSVEAKKNIERLIKDENPDIVHLNNIRHHLTPSIIYTIKKYNIPIVWTLHDYQLICPNISFLSHGKICERCKKRKYFWPPIVRCKKNSFLASAMAAFEHSIQMIAGVYDLVDAYICPSRFLKDKFIEYGFKENTLHYLNYFTDSKSIDDTEWRGNYYLYIGRLSEEKGIKTLIDAAVKVNSHKLKIAGDGPLKEELIAYAKTKNADNHVEFLGHKNREEVGELLKNCKFLVIPSEWYEVTGLVILEAFACGRAVIGSRIGGIPEFVREKLTGLTFEPGNAGELSSKIEYLIRNPDKSEEMGKNGRLQIKEEINAEKHYVKLMEIYEAAAKVKI
jgi:glycosyltransferase involved in cell wall biosynthesis